MSTKILMCAALLGLMAAPALAQEHPAPTPATAAAAAGGSGSSHLLGFAVAFAMALAAFGGAISQGRATAAAAEAVARQPEAGARIQTMMIIGLALIETLVLYTLLMVFLFMNKVV